MFIEMNLSARAIKHYIAQVGVVSTIAGFVCCDSHVRSESKGDPCSCDDITDIVARVGGYRILRDYPFPRAMIMESNENLPLSNIIECSVLENDIADVTTCSHQAYSTSPRNAYHCSVTLYPHKSLPYFSTLIEFHHTVVGDTVLLDQSYFRECNPINPPVAEVIVDNDKNIIAVNRVLTRSSRDPITNKLIATPCPDLSRHFNENLYPRPYRLDSVTSFDALLYYNITNFELKRQDKTLSE